MIGRTPDAPPKTLPGLGGRNLPRGRFVVEELPLVVVLPQLGTNGLSFDPPHGLRIGTGHRISELLGHLAGFVHPEGLRLNELSGFVLLPYGNDPDPRSFHGSGFTLASHSPAVEPPEILVAARPATLGGLATPERVTLPKNRPWVEPRARCRRGSISLGEAAFTDQMAVRAVSKAPRSM